MRTMWCGVVVVCLVALPVTAQTPSSTYERGTIVAVTRHQNGPGEGDQEVAKYEVSVQVRNRIYIVLYTPPNGANSVEYAAGIDLLVLVGQDTLTFPSKLTGTTEVPILRKEALPEKPVLDWSKAPSQYFAMKMQHLSDSLDLSQDQQAKVKPIVEQEAAEAGQALFTTVIPKKERLKKWEKIVKSSDTKMKPILTQVQWDKLQGIRKEQKREVKDLMTKSDKAN
jgi:hypothetical protein